MIAQANLCALLEAQDLVSGLAETLDDKHYRSQLHPELSPLGWHLGHCTWTECYWLQEVVAGNPENTKELAQLYTPPLTPKPERGKHLPMLEELLAWTRQMQSQNLAYLTNTHESGQNHALMHEDYLVHFLAQHYSQHYETMLMILAQDALAGRYPDFEVRHPLSETSPRPDTRHVPGGHYRVGGHPPLACDNELPAQQATLGPFDIACQPVSNSEYLAFMNADAYRQHALWDETGWQWREQHGISCPEHWRRSNTNDWYGIGIQGPYELAADDPVHGLSRYEAGAYAAWAGGRLPHEHQWEVACRLQLLEQTGRIWEWCENTFYPYEGFEAFPYAEYSTPWFDGAHYTLRGASLYTRPAVKRASFRNFYTPEKRHIFAGLRLVY